MIKEINGECGITAHTVERFSSPFARTQKYSICPFAARCVSTI